MSVRAVVALFVLLAAGLLPAAARPLTEAESAALAERVAAFDAAMRAEDYASIIEVIPPRVLSHIAERAGAPIDELRAALIGQIEELFASVTLESFGMDVAAAEERELPDGTPFVFIPTGLVMDLGAELGRMAVASQTLGMMDGSDWYLVRIGDAGMVEVLREVYPEFAGIEFPAETITALKE
jgi:hypothetical protein